MMPAPARRIEPAAHVEMASADGARELHVVRQEGVVARAPFRLMLDSHAPTTPPPRVLLRGRSSRDKRFRVYERLAIAPVDFERSSHPGPVRSSFVSPPLPGSHAQGILER